jgi:hypothetical protein
MSLHGRYWCEVDIASGHTRQVSSLIQQGPVPFYILGTHPTTIIPATRYQACGWMLLFWFLKLVEGFPSSWVWKFWDCVVFPIAEFCFFWSYSNGCSLKASSKVMNTKESTKNQWHESNPRGKPLNGFQEERLVVSTRLICGMNDHLSSNYLILKGKSVCNLNTQWHQVP